jgi:hypothetical protein
LADNQFNDSPDFVKALEFCMVKNKTLNKYDLKYNNITDAGKSLAVAVNLCLISN